MTLAVPLRAVFGLQDFITIRHLENMAKVMLATGMVVGYGYLMETFTAWYGKNPYETVPDAPGAPVRGLCPYLVDDDRLQRRHRPVLLDPGGPAQPVAALVPGDLREHRHVARALRDRGRQPAPRLPAVVVEHVPRDGLGLRDVLRHDRAVHRAAVPVHPLPAGDLDRRDARAGARDAGRAERHGEPAAAPKGAVP